MAILEERGLFWWADEPVPEKQFAPDSALPGFSPSATTGRPGWTWTVISRASMGL